MRTLDNETYQFHGKITNINIFKGEHFNLQDVVTDICEQHVAPDIPWEAMKWEQIGGRDNLKIKDVDLKEICTKKHEEPVTLPLIWNFDTALETCKKLGNGKITGFVHPESISEVNFLTTYGSKYKDCYYFWTPYSDESEEGHYRDVNSGNEISDFDWETGQPNGGRVENIVALVTRNNKFRDLNKEHNLCVSCTVPHKVVYMRGLCEHSFLGF